MPSPKSSTPRQLHLDWSGHGLVAGVDEAGRGPLAGPVVAAAVILDDCQPIQGLADSKVLSPAKRERLFDEIRAKALCCCIAQASVEEIDHLNILHATMLAMRRAVEGLRLRPNRVLVDGNRLPPLNVAAEAIVKGDAKVGAISAASILAKVHRDRLCLQLHEAHPEYGFDGHKGYPTAAHLQALRYGLPDVAAFLRGVLGVAASPADERFVAACAQGDEAQARALLAAQPGLVSGVLPLFPDDGDYGDERWNPVWEAFLDTGFPVGLHSGSRRPGMPGISLGDGAARFMSGMITNKWALAESVSELIHGLVMQRYPDLKFVVVEGQIGWISFFKYYSDHLWEKHRFWTKSALKEPPSHYFERQVFATFMEDPVGLRERHHIGIDNIMWASDYPHSETTWPHSKALTDEWFTGYSDEDRDKILWKNCARLFGLPG